MSDVTTPLAVSEVAGEPDAPDRRTSADRRADDRRAGDDRRLSDLGAPGGLERRRGSRRSRRRRGGFGPEGRLELPKGKLEAGETPREAAVREVREETGLAGEVRVVAELPKVRYAFRTGEGRSVFKTVHYYLLAVDIVAPAFTPRLEEGIVAVEWVPLVEALDSIAFLNLRPVLEAARRALAT